MRFAIAGLVGALLPIILLAGCGDGRRDSSGNGAGAETAGRAEASKYSQQIVFVDFYSRQATLFVDGKPWFQGSLDVPDSSTGFSRSIEAHFKGRTTFRILSGKLDYSRTVEIVPETKIIYVNPKAQPYIEPSTSDAILLD